MRVPFALPTFSLRFEFCEPRLQIPFRRGIHFMRQTSQDFLQSQLYIANDSDRRSAIRPNLRLMNIDLYQFRIPRDLCTEAKSPIQPGAQ